MYMAGVLKLCQSEIFTYYDPQLRGAVKRAEGNGAVVTVKPGQKLGRGLFYIVGAFDLNLSPG